MKGVDDRYERQVGGLPLLLIAFLTPGHPRTKRKVRRRYIHIRSADGISRRALPDSGPATPILSKPKPMHHSLSIPSVAFIDHLPGRLSRAVSTTSQSDSVCEPRWMYRFLIAQ